MKHIKYEVMNKLRERAQLVLQQQHVNNNNETTTRVSFSFKGDQYY
jgi:hypothetical protein